MTLLSASQILIVMRTGTERTTLPEGTALDSGEAGVEGQDYGLLLFGMEFGLGTNSLVHSSEQLCRSVRLVYPILMKKGRETEKLLGNGST